MRLLVGLVAIAGLFAQQKKKAEPPPAVFPLEALRVEGNQKLTPDKILAVAALKIGEPVIRTDFLKRRRKNAGKNAGATNHVFRSENASDPTIARVKIPATIDSETSAVT